MILDNQLPYALSSTPLPTTNTAVKYTSTRLLSDHLTMSDTTSPPSRTSLQTRTSNSPLPPKRDRPLKAYSSQPLPEPLKSKYRWSTILLHLTIRIRPITSTSMALISPLSSSTALSPCQEKTTSSWSSSLLPPRSMLTNSSLSKSPQYQWIMNHFSLLTLEWVIRTTIISSSISSRAASPR